MRGLIALLLALEGCLALGLDEFNVPTCSSSAQCEPLNALRQVPASACRRYQCDPRQHVCALLARDEDGDGDPPPRCGGRDCDERDPARVGDPGNPRAQEVCDGVDNNCNGVVDEGRWRRAAPRPALAGFASPRTLTSARRDDGAMAVFATRGATSASLGFFDGSTLDLATLSYAAEVLVDGAPTLRADACPVRVGGSAVDFGGCTFADLVAAPLAGASWFALAVNTAGCAAGQVRAGWFDQAAGRLVLSSVGSELAVGVDLDATLCTGASRASSRVGASRVALASLLLDEASPHALGAWITREPSSTGCASAGVEALGLTFVREYRAGGRRVESVRGSDAGAPVVLGVTRGEGRPAVVALPAARSFAVAYGGDGGGVRVHVIPDFSSTGGSIAAGAQLTLGGSATSLVSEVAVAPGASSAEATELGVLWREGCERAGPLWFARVRVSGAPPTASALAPVSISASGRLPAIAYVPSGVLAPGSTRGGVVVDAANDGGWVVAWVDGDAALARRVTELDGSRLDEGSESLGAARGDSQGVRLEAAPTSVNARVLGLVHDADGASLVGVELLCGPP